QPVDPLVLRGEELEAEAVRRLHVTAIVAHVAHAGLEVLRHPVAGGHERRRIVARRRDRHRKHVHPEALAADLLGSVDLLLHRRARALDHDPRDRVGGCADPPVAQLLDRAAGRRSINRARNAARWSGESSTYPSLVFSFQIVTALRLNSLPHSSSSACTARPSSTTIFCTSAGTPSNHFLLTVAMLVMK